MTERSRLSARPCLLNVALVAEDAAQEFLKLLHTKIQHGVLGNRSRQFVEFRAFGLFMFVARVDTNTLDAR